MTGAMGQGSSYLLFPVPLGPQASETEQSSPGKKGASSSAPLSLMCGSKSRREVARATRECVRGAETGREASLWLSQAYTLQTYITEPP